MEFTVLLLSLCFGLSGIETANAEVVSDTLHRVEMEDGRTLIGEILDEDNEGIVLSVDGLGVIQMSRADIRSIHEVDPRQIRNGVYWHDNSNATRYLFAPNALSLSRGSGYYQNTWVFFNNVNYGITDRFSIGGGMMPLFLLGANETPVWLLPKFSQPLTDSFRIGAGAMLGGLIGSDFSGVGLTYALASYGSRDNNVTAALGWGYQDTEFVSRPVVNFSFMRRFSSNWYVLSENHFIPVPDDSYQSLISLGMRWAPETFSVDFALVRPAEFDTGGFIGIPWLGVTIPFGER